MSITQVEDGLGSGRTVRVTDGGAARTEPAPSLTASNQVTLPTGASVQVAGNRTGRRQIKVQNTHPSAVCHLAFDDPPATAGHYRLDPGATFEFPPGVSYEGEIEGFAPTANVDVVVIEFIAADTP